jgi:hypothetical protein
MTTQPAESPPPAPQPPQSPVKALLFAAYDDLSRAIGEDGASQREQKRYIREALRELWRALEALPQVA